MGNSQLSIELTGRFIFKGKLLVAKLITTLVTGIFVFISQAQANSLDHSIINDLQDFAQSSVSDVKLSCAPSRGPASANKSYMLSFNSGSHTKTLLIQSQSDKVQYVSLMRDFVEFTRWKTFVPERGDFRVDAVGIDKTVSELVLKSRKPDYVRALESLAPKALDCCDSRRCRARLN